MPSNAPHGLKPTRLRCEYRENPLGVDVTAHRLSWELVAAPPGDRSKRQTAYQILAASEPGLLKGEKADLWDSGKVSSSETVGIAYEGKPLRSGQRVYWAVKAWDEAGSASGYSEPSWWETALLSSEEWKAKWIETGEKPPHSDEAFYEERPAPLFRKEFKLKGKVKRARAYVTGLGYYEFRLNGERVGGHVLDPGWTTYSRRVYYSTYDVTNLLKEGENAAGIMVGNGWYNPLPLRLFGRFNLREYLPVGQPRCILQLDVEYADGSTERIVTDESWRIGDGPILKNSVYLSEVYDARREQRGWDTPGFDDTDWKRAVLSDTPAGPLRAQSAPPIRVKRTLKPIAVTEPQPGVFVFDMGRNFAGWATLRVKGEAGTQVQMRYGELLHNDGTLNVMTSVTTQIKHGNGGPGAPPIAWQSDRYILKGEGEETYTPRFAFRGFRYVEVTGYPGKPTLSSLEGHLLHSDVEPAGDFSCSNEMFNKVQEAMEWTFLSNIFSIQSDCPHREKLGYGGDIVATTDMGIYNFDLSTFYEKVARDFADAALPNGGMPETAPFVGIADAGLGGGAGPVGWGTAYPLLQWDLYRYYGNRRLLREEYPATKRWVEFVRERAKEHILDNGISDHESLVPKPVALTGTAFYYYNVRLLSQIARALGEEADAKKYADLADEIRGAFIRRFMQENGQFDTGTQACQAFALYFGLVEEKDRDAALRVLVRDIMEGRDGHLTTGIFGTKYMLLSLSDHGRADIAYTVANQRDFPGWGHMLESGATTLWEHWEFSDNTFSHNHPMFGSISEWFYRDLAGIRLHPEAVGADRIIIHPKPVGDLKWVKGRYHSVRGPVVSEWKREGRRFILNITVPPNVTAEVVLPTNNAESVTEGSRLLSEAEGVKVIGVRSSSVVCEIGSGSYRFEA